MNKLLIFGTILIVLFSNCKHNRTFSQFSNDSNCLKFAKDSIKSKHFSDIINADSIKIIDFRNLKTEYADEVESIVFIDYKYSNEDKKQIRNLNLDSLISHAQLLINSNNKASYLSLSTLIPEMKGIYVPCFKYSNDYCMYYINISNFICFTDNILICNYEDGLFSYKYSNIKKVDDKITIDLVENNSLSKIEIKQLNDKYNASIWRYTYKSNNNVSYEFRIPFSNISRIPILYNYTYGELTESYEGFDNISLEELFNK